MNVCSVDIEGFAESNLQSFHIPNKYINESKENREIEQNTNVLLEILDEANVKATLFFLGRIAKDIPSIVRKTANAGHEIACHGYFDCDITTGGVDSTASRIAAFLIPFDYSPPLMSGGNNLPNELYDNALDYIIVDR